MAHLLEVKDLRTVFSGDMGETVSVDNVSFTVDSGEIVCLVGESGCGKSVTSLSLMGLLGKGGRVAGGQALFEARDLLKLKEEELDQIRGDRISMVFQDPLTSLNPVFTIGRQITESIRIHMGLDRKAACERAISLLEKVGMPDPEAVMKKYPHLLSGGQRQRLCIARALLKRPRILILDDSTSAVDTATEAKIRGALKRELPGVTRLVIAQRVSSVMEADQIAVMEEGRIVDVGSHEELMERCLPYQEIYRSQKED